MKKIDFRENINRIKEIYPGCYQIILDFATVKFIPYLISDNYKYVWVYKHFLNDNIDWKEVNLPIIHHLDYKKVLAKSLNFDFIIPTTEFKEIMLDWKGGIDLIQMNQIPKYYFDLDKIYGKKKYELLKKECDFLFEVNIPSATDYGTLISNNKEFLESLLENQEINWEDLP